MVTELDRQKLMVRMNALNRAVELLNSEQERSHSEARIPDKLLFALAEDIEKFIWNAIPKSEEFELKVVDDKTAIKVKKLSRVKQK